MASATGYPYSYRRWHSRGAQRHWVALRAEKLRGQQQAQTEAAQDTVVPEENAQEQAVPMDAESGQQ